MQKNLTLLIKAILFIGISIYLSYKFNDSLDNLAIKSPIGWVKGSIILRLLISLSFGRGIQLIFKYFNIKLKPILVLFIGALIGFGISFGLQPIYNTDYGNWQSENMTIDMENFQKNCSTHTLSDEPELILFLSTNCPHCKDISNKLGKLQKQDITPKINAVFSGTPEDAQSFLTENNGQNFYLHFIDDDIIFNSFSGARYPSIFLIDGNKNTVAHWFGGALNYNGLDLIESYK